MQGVGTNRYAYAGGDPVNLTDRNGHTVDPTGAFPTTEEDFEYDRLQAARQVAQQQAMFEHANGTFIPKKLFSDDGKLYGIVFYAPSISAAISGPQVTIVNPYKTLQENENAYWRGLWTDPNAYITGAGNAASMFLLGGNPAAIAGANRTFNFTSNGAEGNGLRRFTTLDGTDVRINSGHAYNRTHAGGDVSQIGTMDEIENSILRDISSNSRLGNLQPRTTQTHTVQVNGQSVGYTLADTPVGVNINYYPAIE